MDSLLGKRKGEEGNKSVFEFANSQQDFLPESQLTDPGSEEKEINIPEAAQLILDEINNKNEISGENKSIKSSYTLNTLSTDHFGNGEPGLIDWVKDIFIVAVEPGDIPKLKDDIILFLTNISNTIGLVANDNLNRFKELFSLKRRADSLQEEFMKLKAQREAANQQDIENKKNILKQKLVELLDKLSSDIKEFTVSESITDTAILNSLKNIVEKLSGDGVIEEILKNPDANLAANLVALDTALSTRNMEFINTKINELTALLPEEKAEGGSSKRKTKKHHKKSKRNHKSKKSKTNKKAKRSKRKH